MDVVTAVSNYVTKMIGSDGAAGPSGKMKILLLDEETVGLVLPAHFSIADSVVGINCLHRNNPVQAPRSRSLPH